MLYVTPKGHYTKTPNNYRWHSCRSNLEQLIILYRGPKIGILSQHLLLAYKVFLATNKFSNSGPVTTAAIPYIRGTSETITRILQPYN